MNDRVIVGRATTAKGEVAYDAKLRKCFINTLWYMISQKFKQIHRPSTLVLLCQHVICHPIRPGEFRMHDAQLVQALLQPFALEMVVGLNHRHQEWPVQSTQQSRVPAVLFMGDFQYVPDGLAMDGGRCLVDAEYPAMEQNLGVEIGNAHVDGVEGATGRDTSGHFGRDE